MSDFLSNFSNDNYQGKKVGTKENEQEVSKKEESKTKEANKNNSKAKDVKAKDTKIKKPELKQTRTQNKEPIKLEEGIELDPNFQKEKRKKLVILASSILLIFIISFVIYRQANFVKVPDFKGKEMTEVRTWAAENKIQLDLKQEYDFEAQINTVISQKIKGKKIKKKSIFTLTTSLGPNPEDKINLPDFAKMTIEAARTWIKEQKAENVSIIEEFNDKTAKNAYLKMEFGNKELKKEDYKRSDKLILYYSKGAEPRKEDIEVPDFIGKAKTDLEDWAKKNEIQLSFEETFSDTVQANMIVSQETAKGKKIAKKDAFKVKVSIGKARVVPNYAQYTEEEAQSLTSTGLPIQVRTIFHATVPFGSFIGQSVEAGTTYKETDEVPPIVVTYSAGRPYLKDLRGSANEGDLQESFYKDFNSKGANVTFETYYVDSSQPKGIVVEMSVYGQYISLNQHIRIGISKGNLESDTSSES
ncbi:MAG: PASTA domain-containing protein [Streptococcaceae bacterium]|jgi:serine/threonine-protein kinase|nr:PASTA domain-containing protein [Streptococcaceae bacterium]